MYLIDCQPVVMEIYLFNLTHRHRFSVPSNSMFVKMKCIKSLCIMISATAPSKSKGLEKGRRIELTSLTAL